MDVVPLFSTPVGVDQLDIDCGAILDYIKECDYLEYETKNGFYSKDQFILDRPKLSKVKNQIDEIVSQYLYEFLGFDKNYEFYQTNSWVNLHREGNFSQNHIHANSLYSYVLYISAGIEQGRLVVSNKNCNYGSSTIRVPIKEYNLLNSSSWQFDPKDGMLVIFPAHLAHFTEVNTSNIDRYSIAGNYFVRGEFTEPTSVLTLT